MDGCCEPVSSGVFVSPFVGIGYTVVPEKVPDATPVCDDFMAQWSEPLWGPSGRDDLQIIRDLGADVVRTYGLGSHLGHGAFLDHAQDVGLKVIAGIADQPYFGFGSSCDMQQHGLPMNCAFGHDFDCHDTIKQHYVEMLKNGYTVTGQDGKRRYHPALFIITLVNECELKMSKNPNHAKVVVSAVDGLLSAEDELGVVGPRPLLTATASYARCPACKSIAQHFPGVTEQTPGLPWLADYFLGFQNPSGFLGYTAQHDLMEMYQTRWVNSYNTPRPADAACKTEDKIVKVYSEGLLGAVPLYIGEFHSSWEPPVSEFASEILKMTDITHNRDGGACGEGGNALSGFNLFEYQVSYWKGQGSEGGTAMRYGFFGLGDESLGKTHADNESGLAGKTFDAWCLFPALVGGGVPKPGDATWAHGVVEGLKGKYPDHPRLCKGFEFLSNASLLVV